MRRAFLILSFLGAGACVAAAARTEILNAEQPQLYATGDGVVWLAYGHNGSVFVAASKDDGVTFSPGKQVGTLTNLMFGMRRGPRIAAHGGRITVTVAGDELLAYSSSDAGKTWTGPTTINDIPASAREGLHDLTVAPDGRLFATWLDQRLGKMALCGAESTDGGLTWTHNQMLYRSPETSICECCHPSALYDAEGNLAVMWRNWLGGSRDLWLMTRPAGANQFTPPSKQGEGSWPLNGCPMDGGDIIAGGAGAFNSVWQRAGEVFLASAGKPERKIAAGKQPVAVPLAKGTWIVWQQDSDLWSAQIGLGDTNVSPAALVIGGRFPALVALPRGGAVLAYESGSDIVVERH